MGPGVGGFWGGRGVGGPSAVGPGLVCGGVGVWVCGCLCAGVFGVGWVLGAPVFHSREWWALWHCPRAPLCGVLRPKAAQLIRLVLPFERTCSVLGVLCCALLCCVVFVVFVALFAVLPGTFDKKQTHICNPCVETKTNTVTRPFKPSNEFILSLLSAMEFDYPAIGICTGSSVLPVHYAPASVPRTLVEQLFLRAISSTSCVGFLS